MTRDEIIELLGWHPEINLLEDLDTLSSVQRIIAVAVLREREDCAKICDAKSEHWWAKWKHQADPFDQGASDGADECAQAIRSRK